MIRQLLWRDEIGKVVEGLSLKPDASLWQGLPSHLGNLAKQERARDEHLPRKVWNIAFIMLC